MLRLVHGVLRGRAVGALALAAACRGEPAADDAAAPAPGLGAREDEVVRAEEAPPAPAGPPVPAETVASPGPPHGAPLLPIPAGTFVMGRDPGHAADESPPHRVTISAFSLEATLVTVADFRWFVAQTGHRTSAERFGYGKTAVVGMDDWAWDERPGLTWRAPWGDDAPAQRDDEPVVMVSWNDASRYCAHLGRRLPTEAEWEYAMRAGSTGTRYPWGTRPQRPDGSYGLNFWQGRDHHVNEQRDGYLYTSPVRAFSPNAWGIYDPVGNVWQWVADWYAADAYARDAAGATDPQGPRTGWARVTRGGSWWCSARTCSGYGVFARGKSDPNAAFSNNGFRCAVDGHPGA